MIKPGLKAWRKRKLGTAYPSGKVSAHFRYAEFYCRDGTPFPAADVNLRALERHCKVLLEPMRARFGACHVMSAYRHRVYNASIGGVPDSFHIWDDDMRRRYPATDLIFATGTPNQWGVEARRLMVASNGGKGGVGIYTRQGFVHVDLRAYVASWRGKGE